MRPRSAHPRARWPPTVLYIHAAETCSFKRDLPFSVESEESEHARFFLSGLVASGVKPPEVLSLVAAQASGGFTLVWVGTGRLSSGVGLLEWGPPRQARLA